MVSEIQAATNNAGVRAKGGLTPDFLTLSLLLYNLPMAALTHLMTVEQFRSLHEDQGPFYHELRHGELVAVTRPKLRRHLIQSRLRDLLRALASAGSFVEYEVAFRALAEHELRVADVAYLSPGRWQQADHDDN